MALEPKRTAGDGCVLPLEICTEILNRLPAKSILRFRSVRKSWYSLVSCPNFISAYSVRNLDKNGNRVLLKLADGKGFVRACSFSSHDESFMESRELDDVPEALLPSYVEIVGSCNGLICFSKSERVGDVEVMKFLIWNPTIRKVVELPSRPFLLSILGPFYFGFGFDSKTGDYKVMFRHLGDSDSSDEDGNDSDCSDEGGDVCEIFDLSKSVWRSISPRNIGADLRKVRDSPECYLNGAVHWTGFRRDFRSDRILLSFDMSDEIFQEIRMPDFAEFDENGDNDDDDDDDYDDYDEDRVETRCVTFCGLIHLIVWKREQNDTVIDVNEGCSVWVMREYGVAESWTRLFNIDLPSAGIYQGIEPAKFLLWENGKVLMVHDLWEGDYDDKDEDVEYGDRQELLLYNTESGKCKLLGSFSKCIRDMCLYEDSLVLM